MESGKGETGLVHNCTTFLVPILRSNTCPVRSNYHLLIPSVSLITRYRFRGGFILSMYVKNSLGCFFLPCVVITVCNYRGRRRTEEATVM
jgi:hypothetical protein